MCIRVLFCFVFSRYKFLFKNYFLGLLTALSKIIVWSRNVSFLELMFKVSFYFIYLFLFVCMCVCVLNSYSKIDSAGLGLQEIFKKHTLPLYY